MVLQTETCRLCNAEFREHGNQIGHALRMHVQRQHPELFKKIEDLEKQIYNLKSKLTDIVKECNMWVNHSW